MTITSGQPVAGQDVTSGEVGLAWLARAARDRAEAGLHREPHVRRAGADAVNLGSNDYLGLSTHPDVIAGAQAAAAQWGGGSTASRLVVGTTAAHVDLENELADFLGFPAALTFSSGYLANVGAVTALAGRGDLIVSDTGSHASLIDGCRLSRARVVVVDRGDHEAVRAALAARTEERALVVTDSVYSIDGEPAPVADLYAAARAHGAVLLVDEAHAVGVRGPGGRGLVAEQGLSGAPDLVVTTVLSKSFGAQGGVVLGPEILRSHLIDCARPFIFDTGLNPAAVGAARAALRVLRAYPALPDRLRDNARHLARACGVDEPAAAVISIIVGDPQRAVDAAAACRDRGVLVGCFRPPSVPPGTSRLRITVRADLDAATLDHVAEVVDAALREVGAR
ncbi:MULTISPECIES: 8-amino-7-oxononanoate synthase [Gordonia]|jgi:8-amino-7-oxononanoate synthase|uniref:8-amino-7-oxononanoate synthase n=2 Tax=Gordonia alkanivorans TaxID=84096 RepID=F9VY55_9ACTN|nr:MULTISPECIES: 8-amino-7-oxononanoate synthase [Gordonia]ASR03874.1 8-amino-7-oxononanoate synthase 1 [Gordonia rubripertincta]AZZ81822.1 8-amino-7-oxononanoate synthase [Gordonia alkanivorans]ETA05095.1 8-amino-7-oxononanoate synthase [Gordonia alkanivorans CGMCC 6845]MDH3008002.1 8-amino-7-oxononanoate synthase [Gordonia alkanivorans]MDH3016637.1 8-amino-7-oxononanoate synthase [Gordonia alkanivorans]